MKKTINQILKGLAVGGSFAVPLVGFPLALYVAKKLYGEDFSFEKVKEVFNYLVSIGKINNEQINNLSIKDCLFIEKMNFKDYVYFRILQESGVLGSGLEEFFQNLKGRTVVFFDTETTGFNPRLPYRQITQLAAVALDLETNTVLGNFAEVLSLNPETLAQIEIEKQNPPSKGWSIDKVLNFSGYDKSKASKKPIDAGESFVSWVNSFNNPLLVAQNAQFDMNFMNNLMKHNKVKFQVLDFLKFNKYYLEPILLNLGRNGVEEAIKVLADLHDPKRNKASFAQQKLGKAFGVETQGAHVALNDVMQLVDLTKKVFDFINRNKQFLSDDIINDYGRARKSWKNRKLRNKK